MTINLSPRAQALLLLALVGALGILIGIGVDRLLASPAPAGVETMAPHATGSRGGGPPRPAGAWGRGGPPLGHFSAQLAEELDLSAQQQAAIDSIMSDNRERTRALMRQYEPAFHAIVEDTRRAIDQVLTEEQRARFRELRAEHAHAWGDSARPMPGASRAHPDS